VNFEPGELRAAAWALGALAGWTPQEVSKVLPCGATFAREWRILPERRHHFADLARIGAPSVIPQAVRADIAKTAHGHRGQSTTVLARKFDISDRSVRRILHGVGFVPHTPTRQPRLTEEHVHARLEFAQAFANHPWRKTWISDEKMFTVEPRLNPKNDVIWGFPDEHYAFEETAHPVSAMAWGAISYSGKTSLLWVDDYLPFGELHAGLNAETYIGILEEAREEMEQASDRRFWFQQDGAKPHTAGDTQEWLAENIRHVIGKGDWPPNSPDLAPIEDIWAIIDSHVKGAGLKTKEELKQFVTAEWDAVSLELCHRLLDSIPDRLRLVRERHGAYTRP
jgi:hypothetical protein